MKDGPVFPEETPKVLLDPEGKTPPISIACKCGGLTKRELFAGMALQGLLGNPDHTTDRVTFAAMAAEYADALLEELGKEESDGS